VTLIVVEVEGASVASLAPGMGGGGYSKSTIAEFYHCIEGVVTRHEHKA